MLYLTKMVGVFVIIKTVINERINTNKVTFGKPNLCCSPHRGGRKSEGRRQREDEGTLLSPAVLRELVEECTRYKQMPKVELPIAFRSREGQGL
jgi:hypothetical protein